MSAVASKRFPMTIVFRIHERFGSCPWFGDDANALRFTEVEPAIARGGHVVLDFEGVTNMTDSFGNALIGAMFQNHPELLRAGIEFKNCNELLKALVSTAVGVGQMCAQRQAA